MAHTTKYGNRYTDQEWQQMQASFKAQDEADNEIETKIDGMINYLVRRCVKFGFSEKQAQTIAQIFRTGKFLEANVQFSSPERQTFIENMWTRFDKAMSNLN